MSHEPPEPTPEPVQFPQVRFPWKRAAALAAIYFGALIVAQLGELRTREALVQARQARIAGEFDVAVERYRQIAARPGQTHNATVYLELAGTLLDAATSGEVLDARMLEEAIEAWNHTLRIDPANASAFVGLARTCLLLREDNINLLRVLGTEGLDPDGELLRQRLARDTQHLLQQAESALRRARSLQPGDALTRFLSAEVHLALGADLEASYLYSSVAHHPEFAERVRERLTRLAERHLGAPSSPKS